MVGKRALICAPRMPEFDREGGSRRIFHLIEFLREAGWAVSFLAHDATGGARYARILRQRGVAVYAGKESREVGGEYLLEPDRMIAHGRFDVAILAFWSIAAEYLPILRLFSPQTRVIVDSIDLHFLRHARRTFGRSRSGWSVGMLDRDDMQRDDGRVEHLCGGGHDPHGLPEGGRRPHRLPGERGDDARRPPDGGPLPLGGSRATSAGECSSSAISSTPRTWRDSPISARRSCRASTLRCSRSIRSRSSAIGSRRSSRASTTAAAPSAWPDGCPRLLPYLERARLSLVPLRHGAGTKTKLIQALMIGTPSVSSSIGIEGLHLRDGEEVLVADDPATFADRIHRLLTDAACWERLATQGHAHIAALHGRDVVRASFMDAIDAALAREPKRLVLAAADEAIPTVDA